MTAPTLDTDPTIADAPATSPRGRYWLHWLLALTFAVVLTALPIDGFKDRQNYLDYFSGALVILLARAQEGFVSLLTNEPLYVTICLLLNALVEPEQGVRILIFSGALLVAFNAFRLAPGHTILVLCFLFVPQVLKNHVVHLRQGLGVGVFLLGWTSTRPRLRWVPMLLSPLIHSSFLFVLLLMAVGGVLRRLDSSKLMVAVTYLVLGLGIGLTLGVVARSLGARQGDEFEFDASGNISGLGFVFWTMPLMVMLAQSREFVMEHVLEIGATILYLATYFLSPVTARVFESSLLLILLTSVRMSPRHRLIFVALIATYAILQWLQIAYGVNTLFSPEDVPAS